MNIRLIFFREIMKRGKNLQTCRQTKPLLVNKVFLHHMSTINIPQFQLMFH